MNADTECYCIPIKQCYFITLHGQYGGLLYRPMKKRLKVNDG